MKTEHRWISYFVCMFVAILIGTGKIRREDALWLLFYSTLLVLDAQGMARAARRPQGSGSSEPPSPVRKDAP